MTDEQPHPARAVLGHMLHVLFFPHIDILITTLISITQLPLIFLLGTTEYHRMLLIVAQGDRLRLDVHTIQAWELHQPLKVEKRKKYSAQ